MTVSDIFSQLKRDEGLRLLPYIDTVGKKTIGYGHNLIAHPIPNADAGITEAQASTILEDDVHHIILGLVQAIPWHVNLDEARRGVLINMAFNMGVTGLLGFHNTLAYVQAGDYLQASINMEKSKWAQQVGARASRLIFQMRTGVWE